MRNNNSISCILLCVFLALTLLSCQQDPVEYVVFSSASLFAPYRVDDIDLDSGIPDVPSLNGAYQDTTNAKADSRRRTTSIGGTPLAKEILASTSCHQIHSIAGTYPSQDQNGQEITLSGRLMLPAKGDIKNVILVSHYTIGANYEAPSESFQLEGILVPMGYALVFSDYLGFGVTRDHIHPYLCAQLTAKNQLHMLDAVMPYLDSIGRKPLSDEIYLLGYSQGGATTVAIQREIETNSLYKNKYKIRRNFAGAGPYDIAATYDAAVKTDYLGIPCAIPMIIQGMNEGENLQLDYSEFFKPLLLDHFDEWINSKQFTVGQIAERMGTNRLSDFMTDEAREKRTSSTSTLYRAMLHNSVIAEAAWRPKAPMYMFHSQDDDTVPFLNSQKAKSFFSTSNIEYNFGHYGTHQLGFVRFLGCVKELLEKDTDIKNR